MKTMTESIKFLKNLSIERGTWQIAIRAGNYEPLYKGGTTEGFVLIPNTVRYWYADPFLFEYQGKTYLFAELFDRYKQKGVIGVATITGEKCGNFKVCIEESFHLSYPLVYCEENEIYMIPEAGESGEIIIYKCVEFPLRWEKQRILSSCYAADTTPVFNSKGEIEGYFSTLFTKKTLIGKNDNLTWIDGSMKDNPRILISNDYNRRSAGKIIIEDQLMIRPAQKCENYYGEALIFYQICCDISEKYSEKVLIEIEPDRFEKIYEHDVRNNGQKKIISKCIGVHTYNRLQSIEVVDVCWDQQNNPFTFLKNLKLYFKDKFR